MSYSIRRVLCQLRYNWKTYSMIFLEFTIGIVVFTVCLNVLFSSKDTLMKIKGNMVKDSIPITYMSLGKTSNAETDYQLPISYNKYIELSDKYSDELRMSFALLDNASNVYFIVDPFYCLQPNVFFMNDNEFEDVFGFQRKDKVVYVGEEAYKGIQLFLDMSTNLDNIVLGDNYIEFSNNKIVLPGGVEYEMETIHNLGEQSIPYPFTMNPDSASLNNCIIFPIESVLNVKNFGVSSPALSILNVQYKNKDFEDDVVPALITELSTSEPNFQFSMADQYMTTQSNLEDMNAKYVDLFIMASLILVIIIIGIIGILLIFLNRRRKSMAISMAYGATYRRIVGELLLEIFLILLSGGIIGLIGAYVWNGSIHISYTEVIFHPVCILFVAAVTIFGTVVSCGMAVLGVNKEDPITVLKDA